MEILKIPQYDWQYNDYGTFAQKIKTLSSTDRKNLTLTYRYRKVKESHQPYVILNNSEESAC